MATASKSPWILHYEGAGCGGCSLEVEACFRSSCQLGRRGFMVVDNPKHGDILLLTGAVNEQNKEVIQQLYRQMPEPKAVVAVGDCACDGGAFRQADNIIGGMDSAVPVDVTISGCATDPEKISECMDAVIEVLDAKARERREKTDVKEEAEG